MLFTAAQRRIFTHSTNGQERAYDPLRVRRLLLAGTGGRLKDVWEQADDVARALAEGREVTAEALAAEERLLLAGRRAFGFGEAEPGDEGYITDAEVWDALNSWSRWVGKASAVEGSGPTSAAPSASGPSESSATGTSSPST